VTNDNRSEGLGAGGNVDRSVVDGDVCLRHGLSFPPRDDHRMRVMVRDRDFRRQRFDVDLQDRSGHSRPRCNPAAASEGTVEFIARQLEPEYSSQLEGLA
jgi:hypothetical protein